MVSRVWICIFLVCSSLGFISSASEEHEFVLTLDSSNFSEIISQHPFIVIEFYAPWCGHCKKLAPEYEKAASILRNHDPAVVLAKVDANDEINKGLATEYEVQGFPTLKILRNGGKSIQDYNGPREADGIVEYLKKQAGPASAEIKSSEDANLINEKKIFVVGLFPDFSGEEFQNFTAVADKLRAHYDFGHTLDSGLLPRGETTVKGPLVRLLKPFDELFVDFKDFHLASLESFIQEASVPIVTFFTKDPENHPFVIKFFESPNVKAMLFVDFGSDKFESFKSKYHDVAERMKGKGLGFLMGDLEASDGAFQYFGLKKNQVPLIIVQNTEGEKYLKANLEPEHVESWLNEYIDGKVNPHRKSEPIPEASNEPVRTVVADNLDEVVFNSGKNVLLEFYAPWCGHCKNLAPILDEVAVSFQTDADVIIAKLDATANDFPRDKFDVKGYPTLYFNSASGKLLEYDSGRTKEDIIDFIQNNRDHASQQEPIKDEL